MNATRETEQHMKLAIDHLKVELGNIRTGKANPAVLDPITVEVYGASMRLKDLATISSPEPRQLLVSPFDPNNAGPIAKAIEKANLGFQPILEGNVVRIPIPSMNEEVRKEMAKLCKKRGEEAKISVRNARREGMDLIKKQKSDGDIAEDLMKKLEKEIQTLTDKYCAEADSLAGKKEMEVMEI